MERRGSTVRVREAFRFSPAQRSIAFLIGDNRRFQCPPSVHAPFWESVSAPGVYFAGNVTQGTPGLQKLGLAANSSSVNGLRYNARVLARHIAEKLGYGRPRPVLRPEAIVPYLLAELARAPELWIQKSYLARVVTFAEGGIRDDGILPLELLVDAGARTQWQSPSR
jgi:hypothetical protein